MGSLRTGMVSSLLAFLSGLRFPVLFVLACVVFAVDLVFPDAVPLVDEILLGLTAVLLGRLRRRGRPAGGENGR